MVSYVNSNDYSRVGMSNIASSPVDNNYNGIFDAADAASQGDCLNTGFARILQFNEEDFKTPREEFEQILSEQGIIARTADKLINNIPLLSLIGIKGSLEVDFFLEKYENDEIKERKIRDIISDYRRNMQIITEFLLETLPIFLILTVFGFFSICSADFGTSMFGGICAGAVSRILLGIAEICTKQVFGGNPQRHSEQTTAIRPKVFGIKLNKNADINTKNLQDYLNTSLILSQGVCEERNIAA